MLAAARFSPYALLPLCPNTQPLSRSVLAHCCATWASLGDHSRGGAQCFARARLWASTHAASFMGLVAAGPGGPGCAAGGRGCLPGDDASVVSVPPDRPY